MNQRGSIDDAKRMLALLARPGDVLELRALVKVRGQQHVDSGYYDDVDALAAAAVRMSGDYDGVYVTINPVHEGLLSRRAKNQFARAGNGDTTSDKDVRRRRSILIDIDPVRPTGISSSNEEHDAAIALARSIAGELSAIGWPAPILADSGNGAHLIYGVDLPVDDGGLVSRVLKRLSDAHRSDALKVDEKVFNPARISKIYGTLTRKGVSTTERPHRYARILEAPEQLTLVSQAQLEAYAPAAASARVTPPSTNGNGHREAFDADAFIARHLPDAKERSWAEGRKWILPVCPFNDAHDRGEAYICQMHSGAMVARCQHESCKWEWRDLRQHFEPDAYTKTSSAAAPEVLYEDRSYDWHAAAQAEIDAFADRDREPEPPPAPKPVPWKRGRDMAEEIWARKDEPWTQLKLGDDEICRIRAGGIAVVMGGSGSGKSSLVSNLLIHHARNVGPAIALSIELPADELGARIVGIRGDASWEDVLRGRIEYQHLADALAIPRLFALDRERATIANLRSCATAARAEFPDEPILVAFDYVQIMDSQEREQRLRVADAFKSIDKVLRDERMVGIAVSQMSRASALQATSGEKIGAESAQLGAESAAIERYASITLSIGKAGEPREDGSRAVELSVGKGRMSDLGDTVRPMSYWGRTGKWSSAGDAKSAATVRDQRDVEKTAKRDAALVNQILGVVGKSADAVSRTQIQEVVTGKKSNVLKAIAQLVAAGDLVEVARYAPRSRSWLVSTPDRAATLGMKLVRDMQGDER